MLGIMLLLACIVAPIVAAAWGFSLHERRFARDVRQNRCTGCGYHLRDLALQTLCPECGRNEDQRRDAGMARYWVPPIIAIIAGAAVVAISVPLLNSYESHSRGLFAFSLTVPFVVLAVILIMPRYGRHRFNAWAVLAAAGGCLGLNAAHTIHNRVTTTFVGEYGRSADLQFAALGMFFLGTALVGVAAIITLGLLWIVDLRRQQTSRALNDDLR